jgi:hypothetical protein
VEYHIDDSWYDIVYRTDVEMKGPSFIINGDSLEFTFNTKTKQWHIRRNGAEFVVLSKVKGDTIITLLELLKGEIE